MGTRRLWAVPFIGLPLLAGCSMIYPFHAGQRADPDARPVRDVESLDTEVLDVQALDAQVPDAWLRDAVPDAIPKPEVIVPLSERRLTEDTDSSKRPMLHGTGSGFALTWESSRLTWPTEVYARMLDHKGQPSKPTFPMSEVDASSSSEHRSTYNQGLLAAAWVENKEVWLGIAKEGQGVSRHQLTHDAHHSYEPSIVPSGDGFFVAWHDDQVKMAVTAANGTKLTPDTPLSRNGADPYTPVAIGAGSQFLVAWEDGRGVQSNQVYANRASYTAGGVPPLQALAEDQAVSSGEKIAFEVTLAWSGSVFAAAWHDARDAFRRIYFVRLDAAGRKIGSEVPLSSDTREASEPSMIWTGREFGVVWKNYDAKTLTHSIVLTRLSELGRPLQQTVVVSGGRDRVRSPSIAWSGTHYGVVWEDLRHATSGSLFNGEIYFAAMGPVPP